MEETNVTLLKDLFWKKDGFEAIESTDQLNSKEKSVILKFYQEQKDIACIAEEMGISRQRVSQIKKSAMDGVRTGLYLNNFGTERKENIGKPINFDDLSTRTRNVLLRNRLRTVEDIINYITKQKEEEPAEAIKRLRNVGTKTAAEILDMLESEGYKLPAFREKHVAKNGREARRGMPEHRKRNVLVLDVGMERSHKRSANLAEEGSYGFRSV